MTCFGASDVPPDLLRDPRGQRGYDFEIQRRIAIRIRITIMTMTRTRTRKSLKALGLPPLRAGKGTRIPTLVPHPPSPPLRKGGKGIAGPLRPSVWRNKNSRLQTSRATRPTAAFHQPTPGPPFSRGGRWRCRTLSEGREQRRGRPPLLKGGRVVGARTCARQTAHGVCLLQEARDAAYFWGEERADGTRT
jgi:hypothetical protein